MNIQTNSFKLERGFILVILTAVALVIIVAVVLVTTGVIETPDATTDQVICEKQLKLCKDACGNDSNCKNDCFTTYQQCQQQ